MSEAVLAPPRGLRGLWDWVRRHILRLKPRRRIQPVFATLRPRKLSRDDPAESDMTEPAPVEPAHSVLCDDRTRDPDQGILAHIRQGLAEVPPLPHVVRELLRELADPMSCARSVARIAASDPALGAALIRTVNSAATGIRRKVNSIQDAVSYLGYSTVRSLVVRMRLQKVLPTRPGQNASDAEDLWIHSLAVAHAAEELARRICPEDSKLVGTIGLLHDIGKLAMNSYFPQAALQLRSNQAVVKGESSLDRERRVLGADHSEIGAMLATHWKLPPDLVEAIRWHHAPTDLPASAGPRLRRLVILIHVANQLAKYCYCYSGNMEIDRVPNELLSEISLPTPMARLLAIPIRRAISRAIFFADENTTQPLTGIRHFLRFSLPIEFGAENSAVSAFKFGDNGPQIAWLEDEWVMKFSHHPTRIDCNLLSRGTLESTVMRSGTHGHFVCRLVPGIVERMLAAASTHVQNLDIDDLVRLPARFVIRRMISNLLDLFPGERVEIFHCHEKDALLTVIHSPAMAFSRRLGAVVSDDMGKAILQRELANVLNLRWFRKISITRDGSTIMLKGE